MCPPLVQCRYAVMKIIEKAHIITFTKMESEQLIYRIIFILFKIYRRINLIKDIMYNIFIICQL